MRDTARYIPVGTSPRRVPMGRIIVHNFAPPGPNVRSGLDGFRVWSDVPAPEHYRVVECLCGWAPHLRQHFRAKLKAQTKRRRRT